MPFSHINDRKCSRTNKDSGDFIYDFKERVLMMENTFMEDINFSKMHVFKYSRRKGTVADRMPSQGPEEKKTERSAELIAAGDEMSGNYRRSRIGSLSEVLTEEKTEENGQLYYTGYTKEYIRVMLPEDIGENRIVCGRLAYLDPDRGSTAGYTLTEITEYTQKSGAE